MSKTLIQYEFNLISICQASSEKGKFPASLKAREGGIIKFPWMKDYLILESGVLRPSFLITIQNLSRKIRQVKKYEVIICPDRQVLLYHLKLLCCIIA